MKDRHMKLIEYVSIHGRVKVRELAHYLGTSEVTIRKDLDILASRGILKRERGYALLNDVEDLNYRMAFHYKTKQRIADAASSIISEGEIIMLDSGSTCTILAETLGRSKKELTIVTNSVSIANYVREYPSLEVILLGGNFQKKSQALVGPMTIACLQGLKVDKIFVGTDGYTRESGFTGDDLIRSGTLREMIQAAKQTYVLTESEKFKKIGTVSFLPLSQVDTVITDTDLDKEEKSYLQEQDIQVIVA